jgi:hypothetical protein
MPLMHEDAAATQNVDRSQTYLNSLTLPLSDPII